MQDEMDAEMGRANEGWVDWCPLYKLEASGGKDKCRIKVRHSKGAVNIAGLEGEGNGLRGIGMDRAEAIVGEVNFVGSGEGEVAVERESSAPMTWFHTQLCGAPYSAVGFEGDEEVEGQQDKIKLESTRDTVWTAMTWVWVTRRVPGKLCLAWFEPTTSSDKGLPPLGPGNKAMSAMPHAILPLLLTQDDHALRKAPKDVSIWISSTMWHKSQSKAKSQKHWHHVASAMMPFGEVMKKQGTDSYMELHLSGVPAARKKSVAQKHQPCASLLICILHIASTFDMMTYYCELHEAQVDSDFDQIIARLLSKWYYTGASHRYDFAKCLLIISSIAVVPFPSAHTLLRAHVPTSMPACLPPRLLHACPPASDIDGSEEDTSVLQFILSDKCILRVYHGTPSELHSDQFITVGDSECSLEHRTSL
ncbi:hypothetical protein BC827DRAFT_1159110 [Russula dissimulans]|nr:hypothetical protein BC827DRAFT_1159110 [Russula dissimulans]